MSNETNCQEHAASIVELKTRVGYIEKQGEETKTDIKEIKSTVQEIRDDLRDKKTEEKNNKRWAAGIGAVIGTTASMAIQLLFSAFKSH